MFTDRNFVTYDIEHVKLKFLKFGIKVKGYVADNIF